MPLHSFPLSIMLCTKGTILLCKHTRYLNKCLLGTYWMSGSLLGAWLQQWTRTKFSALTELLFGGEGLEKTHTLITNMINWSILYTLENSKELWERILQQRKQDGSTSGDFNFTQKAEHRPYWKVGIRAELREPHARMMWGMWVAGSFSTSPFLVVALEGSLQAFSLEVSYYTIQGKSSILNTITIFVLDTTKTKWNVSWLICYFLSLRQGWGHRDELVLCSPKEFAI